MTNPNHGQNQANQNSLSRQYQRIGDTTGPDKTIDGQAVLAGHAAQRRSNPVTAHLEDEATAGAVSPLAPKQPYMDSVAAPANYGGPADETAYLRQPGIGAAGSHSALAREFAMAPAQRGDDYLSDLVPCRQEHPGTVGYDRSLVAVDTGSSYNDAGSNSANTGSAVSTGNSAYGFSGAEGTVYPGSGSDPPKTANHRKQTKLTQGGNNTPPGRAYDVSSNEQRSGPVPSDSGSPSARGRKSGQGEK